MSIEDAAQDHEAMMWRLRNGPRADAAPPAYGPAECEECEAEMPDARRKYGFVRCVACQTALENPRRR